MQLDVHENVQLEVFLNNFFLFLEIVLEKIMKKTFS